MCVCVCVCKREREFDMLFLRLQYQSYEHMTIRKDHWRESGDTIFVRLDKENGVCVKEEGGLWSNLNILMGSIV